MAVFHGGHFALMELIWECKTFVIVSNFSNMWEILLAKTIKHELVSLIHIGASVIHASFVFYSCPNNGGIMEKAMIFKKSAHEISYYFPKHFYKLTQNKEIHECGS